MLMSVIRPVTTNRVIGLALVPTTPIVSLKDGQAFASSNDVATFFGKQHFNVLQDIDHLIAEIPKAELIFQLCPYQAEAAGRLYRAFNMTKDGFTLLAMGFTGAKALGFKLGHPTKPSGE